MSLFFVSALKYVPLEIIELFFPQIRGGEIIRLSQEERIHIQQIRFSAFDRQLSDFPSAWESPEKNKNLNLIKSDKNRKRAKRKCHMSFLVFEF